MDGTVIVALFSTRKKFEKLEKEAEVRVAELNVLYVEERGKITNKEYREMLE